MYYDDGSIDQTFLPEERIFIEKKLQHAKKVVRVSLPIALILSGIFTAGFFFPVPHLGVWTGIILFFSLLISFVFAVNISLYTRDLSGQVKTVLHGSADKTYVVYNKGVASHYVTINKRNYYIPKEFYETVSERDMMEIHVARVSRTMLGINDLSKRKELKFYETVDISGKARD
ncbi:MAG: hypothetical protein HPY53_06245 [Brevinematales bacterium]|nr:hypothetical protein [Brevinematales bacterium]